MKNASRTTDLECFARAIAVADWETLEVTASAPESIPEVRLSAADLPQFMELCSAHGVVIESTNRFAAFLRVNGRYEYTLDLSDEVPAGVTALSASVGLIGAWKAISAGAESPSQWLPGLVTEHAWSWVLSGKVGDPEPSPPPEAEILAALLADETGHDPDEPTNAWAQEAVNRSGLLFPALLLTQGP